MKTIESFSEFAIAIENNQNIEIYNGNFDYKKHTVQDIQWYIEQGLLTIKDK